MSGETNSQAGLTTRENGQWRKLYLIGAVSVMVVVLAGLGDMGITFLPGGAFGDTLTMHAWFVLLQDNPLVGLRNLDPPNLIIIPCGMILFLCLYGAHRHVNKPGAALALLLAAGEAVLAAVESHAPATFMGFLPAEEAGILISEVMLKGSRCIVRGLHACGPCFWSCRGLNF